MIFEFIYASGFVNEYLTPACAAKLMTISGLYSWNICPSKSLLSKSSLKNFQLFFFWWGLT